MTGVPIEARPGVTARERHGRRVNVLFVGNSYTVGGDMPGQVAALALADPGVPPLHTERVAHGGATLKHHAEREAAARIRSGGWTHVVLQEKSTGTLHDREDYHRCVRELAAEASGAEILLFETWARKEGHTIYRSAWSGKKPAVMLARVRAELTVAASAIGASVVPVGTAWARSLERHPELVLHDDDDHHASPLGSHLAAAVFYAWLTGRDPTPVRFRAPGVDDAAALALRTVARDVVREQRC